MKHSETLHSPLSIPVSFTDFIYSPFPFLNLPSEIRNIIYRLVVKSHARFYESKVLDKHSLKLLLGQAEYATLTRWDIQYNHQAVIQPGLLRTCSQIRKEALILYYENHPFDFNIYADAPMHECLRNWHSSIGEIGRRHLRHVNFNVCGRYIFFHSPIADIMKKNHTLMGKLVTTAYQRSALDPKEQLCDLWLLVEYMGATRGETNFPRLQTCSNTLQIRDVDFWEHSAQTPQGSLQVERHYPGLHSAKLIFEPRMDCFDAVDGSASSAA